MDRQKSGKWGVDLGYMGRGKIKWFPSREALEDWLVAGYDSCEGSEKARYEDMLAQLDDGIRIVNYDNIDNYGIVNEDSPSEESLDNTDYKTYIAGIYNIPGGDVFDVISAIGLQEAIDYLIEDILLDDTRRDPEEYADMDKINPDVAAQELKTQKWTKLDDSNIAFISELPYNG